MPGTDPLDETLLRCLVGPTGVGKSELALELCERSGAELVSLDSMQVYRGMDVGTAKPDAAERARVPHHMLDLVEPHETYDVSRFLADVREVLADLAARGRPALFVGGTAFYLKALTEGLFDGPEVDAGVRAEIAKRAEELGPEALHAELARVDPRTAERVHPNDVRRVTRALEVHAQTGRPLSELQREWGWHGAARSRRERALVGLARETDELDVRIRARTARMLDAGWPAEAAAIRDGGGFSATSRQALGYAEVLRLHDGEWSREECHAEVALRTRQFARRQRTWYRKFEDLDWVHADEARVEDVRARLRL